MNGSSDVCNKCRVGVRRLLYIVEFEGIKLYPALDTAFFVHYHVHKEVYCKCERMC